MKIQIQISNGSWKDASDIDSVIDQVLGRETWLAPREKRTPMTTRQQVLDVLATGKSLRFDDDWYRNVRDLDAQPKRIPRQPDYPNGRKLSCGHTVYFKSEVMSASLGSSCQDCYDRMSN